MVIYGRRFMNFQRIAATFDCVSANQLVTGDECCPLSFHLPIHLGDFINDISAVKKPALAGRVRRNTRDYARSASSI